MSKFVSLKYMDFESWKFKINALMTYFNEILEKFIFKYSLNDKLQACKR